MLSCDSLGENVRPAESLTENVVPSGQQLQPTIITSFDCVVVNETLHAVTYPHPVEAEPSRAVLEEVPALAAGRPTAIIDKTEPTSMRLTAIIAYLRDACPRLKFIFQTLNDFQRGNIAYVFYRTLGLQNLSILKPEFVCIISEFIIY